MSNQQTLSRRFTVSSSIVLTAILVVVFSGIYIYFQREIHKQIEQQRMVLEESYQSKGDLLGNLISKITAEMVMSFDMFSLKTIAGELLADADVYKVEIVTDKGQALVTEQDTVKEEPVPESILEISREIRTDPEKLGIDKLVGTLKISIDKYRLFQKDEELKAEGKKTKLILFSVFLLLTVFVNILIAVTLNIILRRVVISPIRKGIDLVTAVADEGDISVSVEEQFTGLVMTEEVYSLAEAMEKLVVAEQEVVKLTTSMANGDWTRTMNERSDKDVLSQSLRSMVENVNGTLQSVRAMATQVSTVSRQLSDSGQDLAQGASEQARDIDTVTQAITMLVEQTESSAVNAKEAREYAETVNNNAATGNRQMEQLNSAMADIRDSSIEIQKIIKTIDDIAFQTNLLALNAAVEAARAGQHGKGFAVVADEVRNLASRSAKAAQETANLIDNSNSNVQNGLSIAEDTGASLKEIVSGVEKINDSLEEIASAANKQVEDIESIKSNVNTIESITQRNSATSEETASMAQELSTQAQMLNEQLAQFDLTETYTDDISHSSEDDLPPEPPQLSYY